MKAKAFVPFCLVRRLSLLGCVVDFVLLFLSVPSRRTPSKVDLFFRVFGGPLDRDFCEGLVVTDGRHGRRNTQNTRSRAWKKNGYLAAKETNHNLVRSGFMAPFVSSCEFAVSLRRELQKPLTHTKTHEKDRTRMRLQALKVSDSNAR